ncbi:hypothetical protein ALI144C_24910 [Actinosynnema sp. ALI-1.44]|uniref:glutathione S-transferase family protein n=1 Tax=Actinosynnema sp. ALI-1.44 TaxID=1933779 RepID=UPI00097CB702|nr:glutathione S-transferase N-terminal domain-containing protein [Actinosynnema sp. ALI-1.44]ONI79960.1 hypothetical protein ALI144C_24910 [Actinosynnema sp. ALI-1.44]
MKVYGSAISSVTQKVLMVFAEKGQEPELVEVDPLKGEDKAPEHLARQPFGEIPVLDDDGFVLYESRAIIRYLDQRLPGPSLTPADLRARGLMEQWISVEQCEVSGPVWEIVRAGPVYDILRASDAGGLYPPPPQDAGAAARAHLERAFDIVDTALATQEFLAGAEFSLAECTWLPYLNYLFASRHGHLVTDRPNLAAWWQRVSTRPTWQRVGRVLERAN